MCQQDIILDNQAFLIIVIRSSSQVKGYKRGGIAKLITCQYLFNLSLIIFAFFLTFLYVFVWAFSMKHYFSSFFCVACSSATGRRGHDEGSETNAVQQAWGHKLSVSLSHSHTNTHTHTRTYIQYR